MEFFLYNKGKIAVKLTIHLNSAVSKHYWKNFNPIQNGPFRGCSRIAGGAKKRPLPLPKICHTYPTVTKLGTVIPYLKNIQKIHESGDTSRDFC